MMMLLLFCYYKLVDCWLSFIIALSHDDDDDDVDSVSIPLVVTHNDNRWLNLLVACLLDIIVNSACTLLPT